MKPTEKVFEDAIEESLLTNGGYGNPTLPTSMRFWDWIRLNYSTSSPRPNPRRGTT